MTRDEAEGLATNIALDAGLTLQQLAQLLDHSLEIWYASELGCYDAEGPTLVWPEDTAVAGALEIFSNKLC